MNTKEIEQKVNLLVPTYTCKYTDWPHPEMQPTKHTAEERRLIAQAFLGVRDRMLLHPKSYRDVYTALHDLEGCALARQIVNDRMQVPWKYPAWVSLQGWLRLAHGIKTTSDRKMQAYTLAWLGLLIEEFTSRNQK